MNSFSIGSDIKNEDEGIRYNSGINDSSFRNTTNNYNNMDTLIWIILFRYQLLSSNNNQLAVIPSIINHMINDFNLS